MKLYVFLIFAALLAVTLGRWVLIALPFGPAIASADGADSAVGALLYQENYATWLLPVSGRST